MARTLALARAVLVVLIACGPIVCGATGQGHAQPAGDDAPAGDPVAQAREAFERGVELANQGHWIDALEAFERARALRPTANTVYNIGRCEQALTHYTRAQKRFREALAITDPAPL